MHPVLERLRSLGNLRSENNFAAWWSGILLLSSAVLAFDRFLTHRDGNRDLAVGWFCLSFILAALSADEIGSLHERLSYFPAGMWRMLIPFALLFLGLFAVTARKFWTDPAHRRTLLWITVAFSLFGLVAIQEYIEHAIAWPAHLESLRAGAEEGTELVAILLLLNVTLEGAYDKRQQSNLFDAVAVLRKPIVVAGVFLCPPLAVLTATFPDLDTRGNPSDWVASAAFFLAAMAAVRHSLRGPGFPGYLTAFACIVGSLAIVLDPRNYMDLLSVDINKRVIVYAVVIACAFANWWGSGRQRPGPALVFLSAMILLMASYGAAWEGNAFYYLLPQYIALATFWFVGEIADPAPVVSIDTLSRRQEKHTALHGRHFSPRH
jgi:hypothetical protein